MAGVRVKRGEYSMITDEIMFKMMRGFQLVTQVAYLGSYTTGTLESG